MGFKVAVAGATGNVGREMLNILAERAFPADEVVPLASRKSIGVEVSYGDGLVTLRIRDYGPGPAEGGLFPGHGLVGMRDRATVAGGTFSAGAADGSGFIVEATLPIAGEPA